MKKVYAIVDAAIREAGGDGLASEECGCELGDLVPCGEDFSDCEIARKRICTEDEGDAKAGDWIMVSMKDA